MGDQDVHGHATFGNVESKFQFTRCIRQGGVEALTLWLKLAMQILWNVEKEWTRKRMEVHMDTYQDGSHQNCSCSGRSLCYFATR